MCANRRNFRVHKEIGVEGHDGDVKENMQYNPYLWPNCRNLNFLVSKEIWVEEHDGDVKF